MADLNEKGTALITGASSGFGALYADRLARRGYDLVLVARNVERLRALAERLTQDTGRKVDVIGADLADRTDLARVEEVLRTRSDIALLVNNAGVAATTPLLQSDVAGMEAMVALNVQALMRLTYAAVPAFVARGKGAVVNIASIVAVAPELLNGVYAGSKAFVLAFSQSLLNELAGTGVRVQVVLPGAAATELWERSGGSLAQLPKAIVMSGADVVDAALSGFDQGEFVTIPSLPDAGDWDAFERARKALGPNLSRAVPAGRYGVKAAGRS
ncbi:MAG: SDR family oxidoreductase [Rhizobiales bacterium]|nr:SDR family oxidoreductase [Hyphomicrobiales bacterium]